MARRSLISLVVLTCLLVPGVAAPQDSALGLDALEWRNIGPAVTGGRIVDFAVIEEDPDTFYVATASGGAWRTDNGGTTWTPVFEKESRVAIGGIAVAPSDRHTLWIGTGEPNARNLRSSSWGDGVYRSRDGGKSWRHMALEHSQHIGRIRIDPRDRDVVFVSVLGSMWTEDPDRNAARGLWRTTDGGESWKKVLDTGERAGAVDVAIDRSRPDRIYAAAWQRERTDWSFFGRGPDSGIFASRDGGDSWERLGNGLPDGDLGRIGLSVCRSRPDRVYAVIDAADGAGGLYRSDDAGASWVHTSTEVGASMYYGQVRCDPNDPDRVYVLQTRMSTSEDGGHTFSTDVPGPSVHVDHHALWIDPADSDHLILGNDGGVYTSRDRGDSWEFAANMPITQFYTVAVDRRRPFYRVYGGTQDNNTLGGPSGTRNVAGIVNADWYVTVGGDGFFVQVDPDDPDTVYTEWQYGNLVRFDATTGERTPIQPQAPVGEHYRWNWSAPVLLSGHEPRRLYFGAQYLFRSDTGGDSWQRISPDLTRAIEIDPEHRISDYGTIRTIAESPFDPRVLVVGSDDGLVQVTEDGGGSWRRAAPLPGLPETWQIVRVALSRHTPGHLYAAASGHEFDDFRPYLYRSMDLGRSWEPIHGDLPADEPVRAFGEHPGAPGLLLVGTEFGVHVSLDDGGSWRSLRNNLPTVPVHDLVIEPRTGDVVLGTHGRGFWILDSPAGLVGLAAGDGVPSDPALFAGGEVWRLVHFDRGKRNQGDAFYRAPNPARGATLDAWLPGSEGEPVELRITDESGALVRSLELPAGSVFRRSVWDLRRDSLLLPPVDGEGEEVPGPLVVPGDYEVRVAGSEAAVTIRVRQDPDVDLNAAELEETARVALRAGEAYAEARAVGAALERTRSDLAAAVAALERVEEPDLLERTRELLQVSRELLETLEGQATPERRPITPTLRRLYRQLDGSPSVPTQDERRLLREAETGLEEARGEADGLAERFRRLAVELDAAGVPWSPGRPLEGSGAGRVGGPGETPG